MTLVTETDRKDAIAKLAILSTDPEEYFDDITAMAAQICGTPVAMITMLDADRQWNKSKVGVEIDQVPREHSFCSHAVESTDPILEICDTRDDPRFVGNPHVESGFVRFYAGAPIRSDEAPIGTLCVLDDKPRQLTPSQRKALLALKRQVENGLLVRKTLRLNTELQARQAELIKLLVHDVKNPLAVVISCTDYLRLQPTITCDPDLLITVTDAAEGAQMCLERVVRTLDAAHPRHDAQNEVDGNALLGNLVREYRFRAAAKNQRLTHLAASQQAGLTTDTSLLRRMLENLLTNALIHTPPGAMIELSVGVQDQRIDFCLDDSGPGVPPDARDRIFDSHVRLVSKSPGHGLGLSMVRQSARSLGGDVFVTESKLGGARFVLRLPAKR